MVRLIRKSGRGYRSRQGEAERAAPDEKKAREGGERPCAQGADGGGCDSGEVLSLVERRGVILVRYCLWWRGGL
jgi:hypothetical protein